MRIARVQGSASQPYIVSWDGADFDAGWSCSCPAWTRNMPRKECRHCLALKLDISRTLDDLARGVTHRTDPAITYELAGRRVVTDALARKRMPPPELRVTSGNPNNPPGVVFQQTMAAGRQAAAARAQIPSPRLAPGQAVPVVTLDAAGAGAPAPSLQRKKTAKQKADMAKLAKELGMTVEELENDPSFRRGGLLDLD